ncbi:hypothetical protein NL676_007034 [Syzygium grande]|nr:hypothetical protein NL676_007034 [Syzygium grande]
MVLADVEVEVVVTEVVDAVLFIVEVVMGELVLAVLINSILVLKNVSLWDTLELGRDTNVTVLLAVICSCPQIFEVGRPRDLRWQPQAEVAEVGDREREMVASSCAVDDNNGTVMAS